MTSCKETSCILCRKYIADKDFQVIDSVTRDILDVLLLKLEFCSEKQDVICNSCKENLGAAFDFKSTCLNTNNTIISHVNCEEMIQVDLNEVYIKVNGSGYVTSISYDDKICRLCMKLIKGEIRCIEAEELEAIQKFIPEMNIMIIKDPVVCTPCFDSLCTHNTFLKNCLDAEQRTRDIGTSGTEIERDASLSHSFIKNEAREESIINEEMEIKTESMEIKSEEVERSYISSWNLNDRHVESTSECQSEYIGTINSSVLEDEEKRHGIKNENSELNFSETFEEQTCKNGFCDYETDQKEEKMHKCDSSDYKAVYQHNLKQHQLKHKGISKEQMFKCDSCDYKAIYKQNLKWHQLRHKIPETEMFKCDLCDYKTIYKYNFKKHQLRHKDIPKDQMFKCNSCEYKTIDKSNLNKHLVTHKSIPEKQIYKCDSCNHKTIYKNNLKKHQLRHKNISDEQMYKCDSCDYKTTFKNNFRRHQLRHKDTPEEQMFKCNLCEYKTIDKSNLNKHLVTHKSIPKKHIYKCDSCNHKTMFKNNLKQHQVRHKNISDEQMHKCDSCDYETIYKCNLITHKLKHKNIPEHEMYKCYSCNFKTVYKQSLIIHQLVHRDMSQNMYKCDFNTKQKKCLTKHEQRHKDNCEEQI